MTYLVENIIAQKTNHQDLCWNIRRLCEHAQCAGISIFEVHSIFLLFCASPPPICLSLNLFCSILYISRLLCCTYPSVCPLSSLRQMLVHCQFDFNKLPM